MQTESGDMNNSTEGRQNSSTEPVSSVELTKDITVPVAEGEYVAELNASHVLAAFRALGWKHGERPPTYSDTRTMLKQLFKNGGNAKNSRELREAAMSLARQQQGRIEPSSVGAMAANINLPEALKNDFDAFADQFSNLLGGLFNATAAFVSNHRINADQEAASLVNAVRNEANAKTRELHEELDAALAALEESDRTIDQYERLAAAARAEANRAEGRAAALIEERDMREAKISEAMRERGDAIAAAERLAGRIEELEKALKKVMREKRNANGKGEA